MYHRGSWITWCQVSRRFSRPDSLPVQVTIASEKWLSILRKPVCQLLIHTMVSFLAFWKETLRICNKIQDFSIPDKIVFLVSLGDFQQFYPGNEFFSVIPNSLWSFHSNKVLTAPALKLWYIFVSPSMKCVKEVSIYKDFLVNLKWILDVTSVFSLGCICITSVMWASC